MIAGWYIPHTIIVATVPGTYPCVGATGGGVAVSVKGDSVIHKV